VFHCYRVKVLCIVSRWSSFAALASFLPLQLAQIDLSVKQLLNNHSINYDNIIVIGSLTYICIYIIYVYILYMYIIYYIYIRFVIAAKYTQKEPEKYTKIYAYIVNMYINPSAVFILLGFHCLKSDC